MTVHDGERIKRNSSYGKFASAGPDVTAPPLNSLPANLPGHVTIELAHRSACFQVSRGQYRNKQGAFFPKQIILHVQDAWNLPRTPAFVAQIDGKYNVRTLLVPV